MDKARTNAMLRELRARQASLETRLSKAETERDIYRQQGVRQSRMAEEEMFASADLQKALDRAEESERRFEGKTVYANASMKRILGLGPKRDVVGIPLDTMVDGEGGELLATNLTRLAQGETVEWEMELIPRHGDKDHFVAISATPMLSAMPSSTGYHAPPGHA